MRLSSPAFEDKGRIPEKYTCQGADINPELKLEDIPDDAESLILIVDDPDAPGGTWLHWLVYDIPPDNSTIKEDSVPGKQGVNSFEKQDYGGPCPPSGEHRYFFRAIALDRKLELEEGMDRAGVEEAMKGNVLAACNIMGTYSKD
jgi:hypothetical protein